MYFNNEDAGDLRAFNEAEFYAEMNRERDYDRQYRYERGFDANTRPGYFAMRPVEMFGRTIWEADASERLPGPTEPPICEGCCRDLSRNEPDGRYDADDGIFFCSEECETEYLSGSAPSFPYREFPTYG